jgi:hypothetical protein
MAAEGELVKKPSKIDWSDPPRPSTFSAVTLLPKHKELGPGIVTSHSFVIKPKPSSKKCGAIWLPALIYYAREAALMFPQFRKELEEMIRHLPKEA